MVAYRDLMFTLICLFTMCTLLMVPAFSFYVNGNGMSAPESYDIYSLGNMGYSTIKCSNLPVDLNKITMTCSYGQISKVYHFGVNPSNITNKDTCQKTTENTLCFDALNATFVSEVTNNITNDQTTSEYLYNLTPELLWTDQTTVDSKCVGTKAQIYVQYGCF